MSLFTRISICEGFVRIRTRYLRRVDVLVVHKPKVTRESTDRGLVVFSSVIAL
jgi:hypothetical protein